MRLGDLDKLKEKLKNGLKNAKNAGKENYARIFEVFIDWVDREPTIDSEPVVKCRECVHNHPEFVGNKTQWCELCRTTVNPGDFCSRGQRKEAGHG